MTSGPVSLGVLSVSKNVMIPRRTLEKIIEIFECLDFARFANCCDYIPVVVELKAKMQRLGLREAYARMVAAADDDARHEARIEYLCLKSQLGNVDVDDF